MRLVAYAPQLLSDGGSSEQPEHIGQSSRSKLSMAQSGNSHSESLSASNTSSERLERRWACGSIANRLSPDWRSYLSKPVLCRGDDGLSNRVDRLEGA
jgi:hypothetical protein